MEDRLLDIDITTPKVKYSNYKWVWASPTPSEGINNPDLFIGVTKILGKFEGKSHATEEFKMECKKLQDSINTNINIAKLNRPVNKNIIENSGTYWKALGVYNGNSPTVSLTNLGKKLASGEMNQNDFGIEITQTLTLPNKNLPNQYDSFEWNVHSLQVLPLMLIIKIMASLLNDYSKDQKHGYLTSNELKNIVIPIAADTPHDLGKYAEAIYKFRVGGLDISSWPNYYPKANDARMINEFLIFLSNYGLCKEVVRARQKRYYITPLAMSVLKEKE